MPFPTRDFGAIAFDYADAWFEIHGPTRPSLHAAERWRQLRLRAINHPDYDLEFRSLDTDQQVAVMVSIDMFAQFMTGELRIEPVGDAA